MEGVECSDFLIHNHFIGNAAPEYSVIKSNCIRGCVVLNKYYHHSRSTTKLVRRHRRGIEERHLCNSPEYVRKSGRPKE